MRDGTPLPEADARVLLIQIAARLAAERPHHPMRPSTREALALTFATRRYGHGTIRAARAEAGVLTHAPTVPAGTTRGQYARLLRQIAGGDQ